MTQIRKPEIELRIVAAARRVFADLGFAATSIAAIAAAAAVSTGNVYRYFAGKDALFAAAVPATVARDLRVLIRRRTGAVRGVADLDALGPDSRYRLVSAELLQFCVAHRLEVVIMLGRAAGTPFDGLAERMVRDLVRQVIGHGASLRPPVVVGPTTRFVLEQLYRGFVAAMVAVLVRYDREADIGAAVDRYAAYHLTGLARILATEPAPAHTQAHAKERRS